MIKVYGITCKLTGTDDYLYSNCPECLSCSYSKMCQAKFNEDALNEARNLWLEGQKMVEEGQQLIDTARKVFENQAKINDVLKYSVGNVLINKIYYAPSVTYPKAKLLKQFTVEQLEPCAEKKEARWQMNVTDMLKEKKGKDE